MLRKLLRNLEVGVIIPELKDTLITYRSSDGAFNMPASIFLNPSFENYRNSIYSPDSLRYK